MIRSAQENLAWMPQISAMDRFEDRRQFPFRAEGLHQTGGLRRGLNAPSVADLLQLLGGKSHRLQLGQRSGRGNQETFPTPGHEGVLQVDQRDCLLDGEGAGLHPAECGQVCSGGERLAQVVGQRANVGAGRAFHRQPQVRRLVALDLDLIDGDRARLQVEFLALAGQLIGLAPLQLDRTVWWWDLLDFPAKGGQRHFDPPPAPSVGPPPPNRPASVATSSPRRARQLTLIFPSACSTKIKTISASRIVVSTSIRSASY